MERDQKKEQPEPGKMRLMQDFLLRKDLVALMSPVRIQKYDDQSFRNGFIQLSRIKNRNRSLRINPPQNFLQTFCQFRSGWLPAVRKYSLYKVLPVRAIF